MLIFCKQKQLATCIFELCKRLSEWWDTNLYKHKQLMTSHVLSAIKQEKYVPIFSLRERHYTASGTTYLALVRQLSYLLDLFLRPWSCIKSYIYTHTYLGQEYNMLHVRVSLRKIAKEGKMCVSELKESETRKFFRGGWAKPLFCVHKQW